MIIIVGDFNINLNNDSGESTQRYKQILHSFSLKQHINKPTRKNKTHIDHICTNIPTKVVHSYVLHTDEISDLDMPYTILNVKRNDMNNVINIFAAKKIMYQIFDSYL